MNHGVLPSVDGGAAERANKKYTKANMPVGQGNVSPQIID